MHIKSFFIALLLIITGTLSYAQTNNTITLRGSSTYNLSPNEIIIQVTYRETFIGDEKDNNKVPIETVEKNILSALATADVPDDKITIGAIKIVRPSIYKDRQTIYLKRRFEKNLSLCISNAEELVKIVRELEKQKLMDEVIHGFEIVETKHTEADELRRQSKIDAFKNAKEKAELILSTSGQKVGAVLKVVEVNKSSGPKAFDAATYEVLAVDNTQPSGFKPIIIGYEIEVVFEII